MTNKEIKLIELVDPIRGNSTYTKEYGEKHKGEYPVFSASNSVPLTHIDHYDFEGEFLTWATNGFGGFLKVLKGKFSINGDRGILLPKKGIAIDMEYLRYALQPVLRKLAKGRMGDRGANEFTKVPLASLKKVSVAVPVNKDGSFDLIAQRKLCKKYETIEGLENYLKAEIIELNDTAIDIPVSKKSMILKVEEIFDLDIQTNTSIFTRQFVDQHKGEIPVYSASKDEDYPGYGYVADNLPGIKYFENTLTWNIDGSVGKAFFREGRFALSEKVIPLILQKKWEGLIDYQFIKFVLEEKAVEAGFGFSKKAGKIRIKDIEIEIPQKSDGKIIPDFDEQSRLAKKYREIYDLKRGFTEELRALVGLGVVLNN